MQQVSLLKTKPNQALANRCATVGVYLPNADKPEKFRMTMEMARNLRNQGLAQFINRKCDIRLNTMTASTPSSASISAGEIYANTGKSRTAAMSEDKRQELMAKGSLRHPEDFIERTRGKVKYWSLTGDNKAQRACSKPPLESLTFAAEIERARQGMKSR